MKKELIISQENGNTKIALLEEGKLFELHEEHGTAEFTVGDVFMGKVRKLAPNLNAAFVKMGHDKDAFLHYQDLGPQYLTYKKFLQETLAKKINSTGIKNIEIQPEIDKRGSIEKVLAKDDVVLLQITKEPISTKGPRISTQISLTGRFLVLIPFDNKVSISKKIEDPEEKKRLKILIESIRPEGFGVIIRTVAEGKKSADLYNDMDQLVKKWDTTFHKIQNNTIPSRVLNEDDKASAILRDNFNADFKAIICDDEELCAEMENYLEVIAPERKDVIQYYDGHIPLFEYYNVEKQLKQSFGKHVNIPSSRGAYLVIEHTEALHVIDVNSGPNVTGGNGSRDHALNINRMAATEIARQLRLRDMGGIIVVDFIDMVNPEHRKNLYEHLKAEMEKDKSKHKILPPSRFGLIQITRQRIRPEKQIDTSEENPNKDGEILAPVVILQKIADDIGTLVTADSGRLYLHVHPFVEAYLTKGFDSIQMKWLRQFGSWISIIGRDSFKFLEYRIYDGEKQELKAYTH